MTTVNSLFVLPVEGADEDIESLRSYIFATAGVCGLSYQKLVACLGPLKIVSGFLAGRTISAGHLGSDINGHSEKTDLILRRLTELGASGFENTTFIAFKDLAGASMPSFLKPTRAWCSACFLDALNANRRPYDKLAWAVRFVDRCQFHELALSHQCPICKVTQRTYTLADTTSCVHCGASLIYSRKDWVKSRTATRGESDLIAILRAAALRPQFRYSLDSIFRFIRGYQDALEDFDIERYRRWHLSRRKEKWMRIKSRFNIVSLIAYAHHVGVPIRLLLERPEEAVLYSSALNDCDNTSRRPIPALKLEAYEVLTTASASFERSGQRQSNQLNSWRESLWMPEPAFASKYLSGRTT